MWSFFVIMTDEFSNREPQVSLPERDDLRQTLGFDRKHKSLRVRIQIRRPCRQGYDLHALVLQSLFHIIREDRIAVDDQVSRLAQEAIVGVGQVEDALVHPKSAGLMDDTAQVNTPRGDVDEEQHVVPNEAKGRQDLDGEEVGGEDVSQVRLDEVPPPHATVGNRVDAITSEDAQMVERATLMPRSFRPPRMRVYPHVGLPLAISTTSCSISSWVRGRPCLRVLAVYFLATSLRYQASRVSGLTSVSSS